jgi:hypothetical protein
LEGKGQGGKWGNKARRGELRDGGKGKTWKGMNSDGFVIVI